MHSIRDDFERQQMGGVWTPVATDELTFIPPKSGTHDPDLTPRHLFKLGVVANEVVNTAWTASIVNGLSDDDLKDPRAIRTLGHPGGVLNENSTEPLTRVPAVAQLGDITLFSVGAQLHFDHYHGVRVDFEEGGETHTIRSGRDWALVDGEPLDVETYNNIMRKMVVGEVNEDDDMSVLFEEVVDFVRPPRTNMANHALIIDDDRVTEIVATVDYDPKLLDRRDQPDKIAQVLVKRSVGLDDPDEFVSQHGVLLDSDASDDSTLENFMLVRPAQVVALRKPLNDKSRTSYRFFDSPDEINQTARDIGDLTNIMAITDLAGSQGLVGTPEPLVIDRRESGIEINHEISDTIRNRMILLGVIQ